MRMRLNLEETAVFNLSNLIGSIHRLRSENVTVPGSYSHSPRPARINSNLELNVPSTWGLSSFHLRGSISRALPSAEPLRMPVYKYALRIDLHKGRMLRCVPCTIRSGKWSKTTAEKGDDDAYKDTARLI